ncbi:DUF1415 domain-containing protein [Idiomarina xiamenensis]|nr:DUF1415 domain-containing protein [Idiomarina xiamenensis]
MPDNDTATALMQAWLRDFIIALNLCPFAKKEVERQRVAYRPFNASADESIEVCALQAIAAACEELDNQPDIATSLVFNPAQQMDFLHYLDVLNTAERLLQQLNYEGIYQLASFHPDYCFADSDADDPANYSNRAPYPCFHLLREQQLSRVLEQYPEPERIPETNIARLRELGKESICAKLDSSYASAVAAQIDSD